VTLTMVPFGLTVELDGILCPRHFARHFDQIWENMTVYSRLQIIIIYIALIIVNHS